MKFQNHTRTRAYPLPETHGVTPTRVMPYPLLTGAERCACADYDHNGRTDSRAVSNEWVAIILNFF